MQPRDIGDHDPHKHSVVVAAVKPGDLADLQQRRRVVVKRRRLERLGQTHGEPVLGDVDAHVVLVHVEFDLLVHATHGGRRVLRHRELDLRDVGVRFGESDDRIEPVVATTGDDKVRRRELGHQRLDPPRRCRRIEATVAQQIKPHERIARLRACPERFAHSTRVLV